MGIASEKLLKLISISSAIFVANIVALKGELQLANAPHQRLHI